MRVITGTARGRKLAAPEGLDTRPTTDLVKEAIFSIIQFEVPGSTVLDLFAGSGQMGVEALSRGAKAAVFVDNARPALAAVRQNLDATGLADRAAVYPMEAETYLASAADRFDIAFLDPPYYSGLLAKLLPRAAARMRETGVIVYEARADEEFPAEAGAFALHRTYRYGKIKVHVYRAPGEGEDE